MNKKACDMINIIIIPFLFLFTIIILVSNKVMKRLLREINIDDDWYGFCLLGDNHFINKNIYTIFTSIVILFFIYTVYLIKNRGKNKVIPIIITHFNEEKKTHIDINYEDPYDDLSKPASPVYKRAYSHTNVKPQSPSNNYTILKPPSPSYNHTIVKPQSPLYNYTILKPTSPQNSKSNDFWEQHLNSYDSYDSV